LINLIHIWSWHRKNWWIWKNCCGSISIFIIDLCSNLTAVVLVKSFLVKMITLCDIITSNNLINLINSIRTIPSFLVKTITLCNIITSNNLINLIHIWSWHRKNCWGSSWIFIVDLCLNLTRWFVVLKKSFLVNIITLCNITTSNNLIDLIHIWSWHRKDLWGSWITTKSPSAKFFIKHIFHNTCWLNFHSTGTSWLSILFVCHCFDRTWWYYTHSF